MVLYFGKIILSITFREGVRMPFLKRSKEPKKEKQEKQKVPKYVEAWGWAASAARFRGLMCIVLSIALVFSLALAGFIYTSKSVYVVGVSPDGERYLLKPAPAQVNFDVFVRYFLGFYASYSPSSVKSNMDQAMKLSTKAFADSFNYVLGSSFINSIIRDNVVQNVSVTKTELASLQENRAVVKAYAVRYRSLGNETKQIVYEIELLAGPITAYNPYGWYVNSIKETNL